MRRHILKALKEQRMAGKTFIFSWEEWEEFCAEHDINPCENGEFGLDLGGGNSLTIECRDDPPEEETE